ncbi:enoyl-CoA hydratase/isomerase family protein [Mycobacterium vicinigordonae]|uniref:Enoyl-CoA hydratase/isomerase family protein n=1 Tax=Mycobacterium vicinigordonae TaxID=1719132 RepID=A0A7D6E7F7_9MYCO|nr:enoyl-CoA hydratase/isomerase family protein [Mycobacterium vicinigordonae]QLL08922.1 enoyl-CoA hydratase/isomerase family protein [Mycobacterium vicinigordonae]
MTSLPDSLDVDLGAPELLGRIQGDTFTVTIQRPEKKNSVTADGYHGIKRAAMIVADEPELNFLVITGAGDAFCAGGDMNALGNPDRRWDAFTESYDGTPFETLGKIPKLVVCAVNGIALGGGLVMTLFADLVVASERARFRVPDLTRGVYEAFVAARLPQRMGTLRANHLIYGNDWITAADAERLGLVGKVVAHHRLQDEVDALLERVRKTGPAARAAVKREMARALPPVDVTGYWSSIGTSEQIEAFTAFLQKRSPQWQVCHDRDAFVQTRRPAWLPADERE